MAQARLIAHILMLFLLRPACLIANNGEIVSSECLYSGILLLRYDLLLSNEVGLNLTCNNIGPKATTIQIP